MTLSPTLTTPHHRTNREPCMHDHEALSRLSDDEIAEAVKDSDTISLLLTVSGLLDDPALLRPEFRPRLIASAARVGIDYGLDDETMRRIEHIVVGGLQRLRDRPVRVRPLSEEYLRTALEFIAGGPADDGYLDVLKRELSWPDDVERPNWQLEEISPDREFRVAIIGAGMSGILMALRLQQAGIPFTIFERGSEAGGTWAANTYPGCRLDSSNFTYSYSFEQVNWREFYSSQPAILRYFNRLVDDHGLRARIRFDTEVTRAAYADGTWSLEFRDHGGDHTEEFSYVVSAVGQLSRPSIPDLPGLDAFPGEFWHTAEWPADADLRGKRVAVVGTGASAYQVVPAIAGEVGELAVYQRSAPWLLPTPVYTQELPTGFSRLLDAVPLYGRWNRFVQFWTALEGRLRFAQVDPDWDDPDSVSELNAEQRRELVAELERQFADAPELLEHVVPDYPPGGKRMLRDDGRWSQALMQDNVTLVPHALAEVDGRTLIASDGSRFDADVIVFATGFKAAEFLEPMEIVGADGVSLHDRWDGDPTALLGMHVDGFPNLAMLYGPNNNLVVNGSLCFITECAVHQIMLVIERMLREGTTSAVVTRSAVEAFTREIDLANRQMAWGSPKVNSWYKGGKNARVTSIWPLSMLDYWKPTHRIDDRQWDFA